MRYFSIAFYIILIIALIATILFAIPDKPQDDDQPGENDSGDSGDIGVNVTTGKVKVDITDVEGNSILGTVLKFESESEDNSIIFAPGCTFYTEGFKVKNTGNLKVIYCMYVSRPEGVDMEKFDEAFEFYVTTSTEDIENAEQLKSFDGILEAGQASETYYLVVKMKDSAGNEFQEKTFTGIGITVNATQVKE